MKYTIVKCDNEKEWFYIQNYYLKKGYKWRNGQSIIQQTEYKYPVYIFYNINYNECTYANKIKKGIYYTEIDYKIFEAKFLYRKEKLKKLYD